MLKQTTAIHLWRAANWAGKVWRSSKHPFNLSIFKSLIKTSLLEFGTVLVLIALHGGPVEDQRVAATVVSL